MPPVPTSDDLLQATTITAQGLSEAEIYGLVIPIFSALAFILLVVATSSSAERPATKERTRPTEPLTMPAASIDLEPQQPVKLLTRGAKLIPALTVTICFVGVICGCLFLYIVYHYLRLHVTRSSPSTEAENDAGRVPEWDYTSKLEDK
ncbi:unnamed protein product [Clonostachys rosea]|uniref:Uncharacterized protein n=1 Tax=Bionectria ochroleuca TaxID=29856 RepID=A0ABY6V208_BIOOC|nr:unnamed protein product [Clonostachys rosea]